MERGEPAERGRQRAAGHFLDHAKTNRPGQARCRQSFARRLLELKQTAGVAEQHFPFVRQRDTACCAPEQGPSRLGFQPLDLLTDRRLGQVEPLRRAVEAAVVSNRNEGPQQFEVEHGIDPIL